MSFARRSLLGLVVPALLFAPLPAKPPARAVDPFPGLADRVKTLVAQLGDAAKAPQAETQLIELGPAALPLLPASGTNLTKIQAKRLAAVRTTLKDISPTLVTIAGSPIRLKDALVRLEKQSKIPVLDKRRVQNNPPLQLNLKEVPFWQALDAIAQEAKASVSLYQGEGQVALVDGNAGRLPVSYSGLFRTVVKRIAVAHDLETGAKVCTVTLEVAWEPRLRPFYLDQGSWSVSAKDAGGKAKVFRGEGTGSTPVAGRSFLEFELRFPAPPRAVKTIDLVQGRFALVTPSKMLEFRFPRLAKGEKTKEGVTVRITRVATDDDPWDVGVSLRYAMAGPKFESYQSWLLNNEISLVKKGGKGTYRPLPGDFRIQGQPTYPRARILYHFRNPRGALGNPKKLAVVYRTPGRIVTLPARYEFKDLPLP
jgi:hypothetical protein